MFYRLTLFHVIAGYETGNSQEVHRNWELAHLFYRDVLVPKWHLPSLDVLYELREGKILVKRARKRWRNIMYYEIATRRSQEHPEGCATVCSFVLRDPFGVKVSVTLDRERKNEEDKDLLTYIEIVFNMDDAERHRVLPAQLLEAGEKVAKQAGIHIHNEDEWLSGDMNYWAYKVKTRYMSYADDKSREPDAIESSGKGSQLPVPGQL